MTEKVFSIRIRQNIIRFSEKNAENFSVHYYT